VHFQHAASRLDGPRLPVVGALGVATSVGGPSEGSSSTRAVPAAWVLSLGAGSTAWPVFFPFRHIAPMEVVPTRYRTCEARRSASSTRFPDRMIASGAEHPSPEVNSRPTTKIAMPFSRPIADSSPGASSIAIPREPAGPQPDHWSCPGPLWYHGPTSVDSRKRRSRSVLSPPPENHPSCGVARRFEIVGRKRLPARQNSHYGHLNQVSVYVKLGVDDKQWTATTPSAWFQGRPRHGPTPAR
jgi:hypothetical protein